MTDTTNPGAEQAPPLPPHADAELLAGVEAELTPEPAAAPGAASQPQLPPTHVVLAGLLTPTFASLAPNWNIKLAEVQQLSLAYGAVIDKYFPDGLGNYGPEIMATLATIAIFGPRLKTPRVVEEKPADA